MKKFFLGELTGLLGGVLVWTTLWAAGVGERTIHFSALNADFSIRLLIACVFALITAYAIFPVLKRIRNNSNKSSHYR